MRGAEPCRSRPDESSGHPTLACIGPETRRRLAYPLGMALALAVLGVLLKTASAAAPAKVVIDPRQAYNVKAVYLYSFGRYVDWPRDAVANRQKAFVIGVLGADPFGKALDHIAKSKRVSEKPIVVRRFKSMRDYQPCHILFVPKSVPRETQIAVIDALADQPVLVTGEHPGFAQWGGTINFYLSGETVRFEVNVDVAKKQRLSVDAKLLNLARMVRGIKKPPVD